MERKKRAVQSETDIAVEILKTRQAPIHYKELITEVLQRMGEIPANPGVRQAEIHTEINLDSRFVFVGKGMWGLAAWSPKTHKPVVPVPNERNYQPKHSDYVWEDDKEDAADDESECLVPADEDEGTDDDFPLDDGDEEEVEDEPEADDLEGRLRKFMKK